MQALLLDVDGVLLEKGEFFSEKYSREYAVPIETIEPFFKGPLKECQLGKADLKVEISPFLKEWGWKGTADEFLAYWFADMHVSDDAPSILSECADRGIACWVASNNEYYRARAVEQLLGNKLEGYFFSSDLGVKKNDPAFFEEVIRQLNIPASEIGFLDNDSENVEAARETGVRSCMYKRGDYSDFFKSV